MPLLIATTADIADIVALVESAFRGDASRAGWTTEADFLDGRRTGPDEIEVIIADPKQRVLLERDDAAALSASVVVSRDGDTASFGMLAVAPTRQGAGTGRRVLHDVEHWVTVHWKSRRMRMKVIAQRAELIAWYERRGYRLTGESEPFYYGDERFGLPRRPDLKFAVMEKDLSGIGTG